MDFFSAAQVFGTLSAPGNFLILMLVIGLALGATRYRRAGRRITLAAAAALAILLVFPVGAWVMSPLENRFPRPQLRRRESRAVRNTRHGGADFFGGPPGRGPRAVAALSPSAHRLQRN
jgi:hypothetical protein